MTEPLFHVVRAFDPAVESWTIRGVFTHKHEALALRDQLPAGSAACVDAVSLAVIEQLVFEQRLGRLRTVIEAAELLLKIARVEQAPPAPQAL
jgi:plasmid replication initiation protein